MNQTSFQPTAESIDESMTHLESNPKSTDSSSLPLSQAQLGIWIGQLLDTSNNSYWTAQAFELTGVWNETLFVQSVQQTIAQSETLHMCFSLDADGLPCQSPTQMHFDEHGAFIADRVERLSFEASIQPEQAAQQWMQEDLASSLVELSGSLFRTAILTLSPNRHLWYLRTHHIALDGYAYALLARQVAQHYTDLLNDHRPLKLSISSLREVIEEDLSYTRSRSFERDCQFWATYLSDLDQVPDAGALCIKQSASSTCHNSVRQISAQDWSRWQEAAQSHGVDWIVWLTAIWGALQLRIRSIDQVRIGFPVMGRLGSVALTVPCMYMNIIPIVLQAEHLNHIDDWLNYVAQQLRAVKPHQRYRYEKLKDDFNIQGATRLFSTVLNMMPFDRSSKWGDLTVKTQTLSAGPVEDLAFNIIPNEQGLSIEVQSNPAAYSINQTEQLIDAWIDALNGFYKVHQMSSATSDDHLEEKIEYFNTWLSSLKLDDLIGLTFDELGQIQSDPQTLAYTSSAELVVPHKHVMQNLMDQARIRPQHTALMDMGGNQQSYDELLKAIQNLAIELKQQGVTQGNKVILITPRQSKTIVAIYALLWLGACYIPLDPATPQLRLLQILEDAQADFILTDSEIALECSNHAPILYLDTLNTSRVNTIEYDQSILPAEFDEQITPAYMIYTSGSTGKPNGVMISHASLAYFVQAANQHYKMSCDDRVLQFAPLHFDASIEEVFVSLSMGATLILRHEQIIDSMDGLLRACIDHEITVLDLPTAFWHEWVYGLQSIDLAHAQLRLVILGGEAILAEHLKRWHHCVQGGIQLLNSYGPTEATVICTLADLSSPDHIHSSPNESHIIPIGQPLTGLTAVVVDEQLRVVARHQKGELCIGGPTLAMRYWQREEATAKRFIDLTIEIHHTDHMRVYRTGDLVCMDDNGVLYYLGRLDDEFKISGYRIDVNEVENALLTHPNIKEAVVLGYISDAGLKQLVAFYVVHQDKNDNDAEFGTADHQILTHYLGTILPRYAIPTVFNALNHLPRNANNKVDKKVLRQQLDDHFQNMVPLQTAHSRLEAIQNEVVRIWQEVLGQVVLDIDQDFFALGGKSLQAIQIANRLRNAFQQDTSMAVLFRLPTVRQLTEALDEGSGHQPPHSQFDGFAPLLALQPEGKKHLFCVHPTEGLSWCYMGLSAHLDDCAIYGLQSPFMKLSASLEHIASIADYLDKYVAFIREVQPQGPYHLIGWSSGGGLAQALAVKLQKLGEKVPLLAIMDAYPSDVWEGLPEPSLRDAWEALLDVIGDTPYDHHGEPLSLEQIKEHVRNSSGPFAHLSEEESEHLGYVAWQHMLAYRQLKHELYQGDLLYFRATQIMTPYVHSFERWQPYISGKINCVDIDSTHSGMCRPLPLAHIGRVLSQHMSSHSDSNA